MDNRGLAMEAAKILTEKDGAFAAVRKIGEIKITDVRLDKNAAGLIGRSPGRYITLEGQPYCSGMTALLRRGLQQLLPPSGRLFVVGLGNPDITQDSLGAMAVRRITVRKSRKYRIFAMETDVAANTGISSAKLVRGAAREIRADCVIAIDALACNNPRYIGGTVQLSDSGIIPGSGTGTEGMGLNRKTLGIPIAAVGVPTVTALSSVTGNKEDSSFLITSADIALRTEAWADAIGRALDML